MSWLKYPPPPHTCTFSGCLFYGGTMWHTPWGPFQIFCKTQWPRPLLFSLNWIIQWSMGEGSYITLFSPSDVTAFHRISPVPLGAVLTEGHQVALWHQSSVEGFKGVLLTLYFGQFPPPQLRWPLLNMHSYRSTCHLPVQNDSYVGSFTMLGSSFSELAFFSYVCSQFTVIR